MAAARARSHLSALFSWAMAEGMCEINPVIGTNNPSAGVPSRDRTLTDRELAAIWAACLDDDFGRIIKLLTLSGCRREEIGAMKWSEVDFDAGVLTIPAERVKNRRTLTLPLPRQWRSTSFARSLNARDARTSSAIEALVLAAGATRPCRCTRAWLQRVRRSRRGEFTICEERCAVAWATFAVPPHIAELAIGHARKGIEATYDRYSYQAEIGEALARWADHVASAVEGRQGKIVPLHA